MADFEKAIPLILKHEGGYVNHPNDPGGETNYGITDRLDGKIDGMIDLDGDRIGDVTVKGLTIDQAKQVYRDKFWNKMRGDDFMNQQIANLVFDSFVNMGINGIKILQRELGVTADGNIGDVTIGVVNKAAGKLLFDSIKDARIQFYENLVLRKPELKIFLNGWKNRVNQFKYDINA